MEYRWIRNDMDLNAILDRSSVIKVKNSGILEEDFYKYARDFNEAANIIMYYLLEEASSKGDIAKLDLWYYALVYLYRQSIELMLKANILKLEKNDDKRKELFFEIGHDVSKCFDELVKLANVDIANNNNIVWLQAFLKDVSAFDRSSDMFRYPFARDLHVLFDNQTHVHLPATYYNMNRTFEMLNDYYRKSGFSNEPYDKEKTYAPALVVEGNDYYYQSVVGYKYNKRAFFPYNASYQECGDFLENKIKETGKINLFMPMCYLYRNAVELGLKKIVVESSSIEPSRSLKIIHKKNHSILGLWNSIYPDLKSICPPNDKTLEYVEKYIHDFHKLDVSSDKFRYPCNKELELYYADEAEIDINNFSNCFVELINFLDGADGLLMQIKEQKLELESYYR